MAKTIFCDEYGNTGGNLVDRDQPVFAYAFVAIERATLDDAERLLALASRGPGGERVELKSTKLITSRQGRQKLASIGAAMASVGVRIVLSIVEKRYQICFLIVETYLDPIWCEGALEEMLDAKARRRFADACYDALEDTTLTELLKAVRADDATQIGSIGDRISHRLQLHPDDFVYRAARTMVTNPERVFRHCKARDMLPTKVSPASQYAAFYPGLKMVDAFLDGQNETATVIRDNDTQHGAFLDLVFATGKSLQGTALETVYGAQRLERLVACEPVSSSTSVGVQIADLAVGVFGRAIQSSIVARRSAAEAVAMIETWRAMLLPPSSHYVAVSDAQLPTIKQTMFGREEPREPSLR